MRHYVSHSLVTHWAPLVLFQRKPAAAVGCRLASWLRQLLAGILAPASPGGPARVLGPLTRPQLWSSHGAITGGGAWTLGHRRADAGSVGIPPTSSPLLLVV